MEYRRTQEGHLSQSELLRDIWSSSSVYRAVVWLGAYGEPEHPEADVQDVNVVAPFRISHWYVWQLSGREQEPESRMVWVQCSVWQAQWRSVPRKHSWGIQVKQTTRRTSTVHVLRPIVTKYNISICDMPPIWELPESIKIYTKLPTAMSSYSSPMCCYTNMAW